MSSSQLSSNMHNFSIKVSAAVYLQASVLLGYDTMSYPRRREASTFMICSVFTKINQKKKLMKVCSVCKLEHEWPNAVNTSLHTCKGTHTNCEIWGFHSADVQGFTDSGLLCWVTLPLCTPWRHMVGAVVKLHAFLLSALHKVSR